MLLSYQHRQDTSPLTGCRSPRRSLGIIWLGLGQLSGAHLQCRMMAWQVDNIVRGSHRQYSWTWASHWGRARGGMGHWSPTAGDEGRGWSSWNKYYNYENENDEFTEEYQPHDFKSSQKGSNILYSTKPLLWTQENQSSPHSQHSPTSPRTSTSQTILSTPSLPILLSSSTSPCHLNVIIPSLPIKPLSTTTIRPYHLTPHHVRRRMRMSKILSNSWMETQISLLKIFRKQQQKRKKHQRAAKNKIQLMNTCQRKKVIYPPKPTNPPRPKTSRKILEKQSCGSSGRMNRWPSSSSPTKDTTSRSFTWCWAPTRTKSTPSPNSDPYGWTKTTNSRRGYESCQCCTSASITWGTSSTPGSRTTQGI